MIDNSFKRELDAELMANAKRRFITIVVCTVVIAIGAMGVYVWIAHQTKDAKITYTEDNQPNSAIRSQDGPKGATEFSSPSPSQIDATALKGQSSAAEPQTYTSTTPSVNKAAFVSSGQTIIANYNQIVGLVTFSPSMSDGDKISRIEQAVALDRQYFSKTTDLRGQLVLAGVSSGPYMNATELAESGVSKISVGLTFMDYWANNSSRTNDLQSGLSGVAQGSSILLDFSNELGRL